jgi:hypothetical protein
MATSISIAGQPAESVTLPPAVLAALRTSSPIHVVVNDDGATFVLQQVR